MSERRLEPDFERVVPAGDDRERAVCRTCGFVDYENPRVVVGAVVTHEGRYLLCRRSIEPRRGFWTMCAGFLEQHESPTAGAMREAMEEANAAIEIDRLLAIYTIERISQIQLIYRATLARPEFSPGYESLECRLFDWGSIPWDAIAFPTVTWALRHHRRALDLDAFPPYENP